jgi:hypothetical protein
MNKLVVSLVGCSSSIAAVLVGGSIANTDSAKTIPYPEVMNLARVPRFTESGMVPQQNIASTRLPQKSTRSPSVATANPVPVKIATAISTPITTAKAIPDPMVMAKVKPAPITVDLVSSTVREAALQKYGGDCPGCRNLSPSMMVLGYSSYSANGSRLTTTY